MQGMFIKRAFKRYIGQLLSLNHQVDTQELSKRRLEGLRGLQDALNIPYHGKMGHQVCHEKQNEMERSTLVARVFPGIALLPSGYNGTVDFLNLLTMEVVKRDQLSIHHCPNPY